ncbi:VWA domain-containing protein [Aminipila butyrica]|uniref:VWA domain-containing protein n=1 Tax=Aminipila butyrica TaxID=433296 RepID=A0A858BV21_9FIRM|nr:VWA domain-containing protein [Aminipila butyrica]QIB69901.1 VWA domain-containing protein [Aminipila butyrica]
MFLDFFYLLRARGLSVSLNEWMSLMEALDLGLAESSLLSFYHLCRSLLVKSEADYDKFDSVFAEYFRGIESPEDLPEEFWRWLNQGNRERSLEDRPMPEEALLELEALLKRFQERLEEQKEQHDGGNYWIGTGGTSRMGYGGYNNQGIRTGGTGRHRSAVQVAGERHFKDFRQDNILDTRQFQLAFRKLRQFSARVEGAKTELNLDATIEATGNNGGNLKLVFDKPRKNTIKLLLLFDSDGSMTPYSLLCSRLFQAVSKSSHFKDLKVYYFHNCIYDHLYTTPTCRKGDWVNTDWVLSNLDSEYKLILVGDGTMAPSELLSPGGNSVMSLYNQEPGLAWLHKLKKRYKKQVWLNPIPREDWDFVYGSYTLGLIRDVFPMFELTVDGLDEGIKKLLVRT